MTIYRYNLPQLDGGLFLTDSGLETILYFQEGVDLPEFAAFPLLDSDEGRARIVAYLERHGRIALDRGLGFILETPTWRANADWGARLGYDRAALARVNTEAVRLMESIRDRLETPASPFVISGNLGPRGDGYNPAELLGPAAAAEYHNEQISTFARAGADLVTALTLTHTGEAIGIARAAAGNGMPVVLSFTTETDGQLPTGQTLGDAIEEVDAATGNGPAYYMINCAHPTHFAGALAVRAPWLERIRGLRANASRKSHEELDNSTELDEGNPVELGEQYRELRDRLPQITVLGGCCGTDHRHVEAICLACAA